MVAQRVVREIVGVDRIERGADLIEEDVNPAEVVRDARGHGDVRPAVAVEVADRHDGIDHAGHVQDHRFRRRTLKLPLLSFRPPKPSPKTTSTWPGVLVVNTPSP